jgi:hypothetical protein
MGGGVGSGKEERLKSNVDIAVDFRLSWSNFFPDPC